MHLIYKVSLTFAALATAGVAGWAIYTYGDWITLRPWVCNPRAPMCGGSTMVCQTTLMRPVPHIHESPVVEADSARFEVLLNTWALGRQYDYLAHLIHANGGEAYRGVLLHHPCCVPSTSRYYTTLLVGVISDYYIYFCDPVGEPRMTRGNFSSRLHCPLAPTKPLPITHTMGRIRFQSWPNHYHGYLTVPETNYAVLMPAFSYQDTRYGSINGVHPGYKNTWWSRSDQYNWYSVPVDLSLTRLDLFGLAHLDPLSAEHFNDMVTEDAMLILEEYRREQLSLLRSEPGLLIADQQYGDQSLPTGYMLPWPTTYTQSLVGRLYLAASATRKGSTLCRPGVIDPSLVNRKWRATAAYLIMRTSPGDQLPYPRPLSVI